jgi:hypothetical protein
MTCAWHGDGHDCDMCHYHPPQVEGYGRQAPAENKCHVRIVMIHENAGGCDQDYHGSCSDYPVGVLDCFVSAHDHDRYCIHCVIGQEIQEVWIYLS